MRVVRIAVGAAGLTVAWLLVLRGVVWLLMQW